MKRSCIDRVIDVMRVLRGQLPEISESKPKYLCRQCIFLHNWAFTHQADGLPQNLVKSWSCRIQVYTFPIALKWCGHLCSCAAQMPVKFQSDGNIMSPNLAASKLDEIWRWDVLPSMVPLQGYQNGIHRIIVICVERWHFSSIKRMWLLYKTWSFVSSANKCHPLS